MNINMAMWDANILAAPRAFENMISRHMDLSRSTVLDFGCGFGVKSLGIAINTSARSVIGVDINENFASLEHAATKKLNIDRLPENLRFTRVRPGEPLAVGEQIDCIFSWSVFEHVRRDLIPGILSDHHAILPPNGMIFLQINPLYYSPFGSHLNSLIDEPWAHLDHPDNVLKEMLFSASKRTEHTGISGALASDRPVTDQFRDGLWNCYRTLNKVTVNDLERYFSDAGFEVIEKAEGRTKTDPPRRLLDIYHEDVLRTDGVQLAFRKKG